MIETTVAIVGAGLAGLCAARALNAAGVDFVLVEARERAGGRIFTADRTGAFSEDGFDLGPSWYWPQMQAVMAELIEELGLEAFPQNGQGDVIFERMSREKPQRYSPTSQDVQSMRLVGGTAALVRALTRDLPADRVLFNRLATKMTLGSDRVSITIERPDGGTDTLIVRQVIAALPPRLLDARIVFEPEQEPSTAARWRDTATWMAPHAKFFALYDRPFWQSAGLSGTAQSMVGPMVEIHDATTATGAAALFGFLGVGADQRAALGEAVVKDACINQFARLFGPEALKPHSTLFKDWAADPLTATAADRIAGGHPAAQDLTWVSGPWQRRLALAGTETSPSEPGFLAGAVIAAKRAVAETLAGLSAGGH